MGIYSMPDTFYTLSHLFFTGDKYYFPSFTAAKIDSEVLSDLPRVPVQVNGRA